MPLTRLQHMDIKLMLGLGAADLDAVGAEY